jgi:NAD+ synthase (glutamine-hydrolysing)
VRLIDLSEYKRRQSAPGLRVTTKAFGVGRRMPVAQAWREA